MRRESSRRNGRIMSENNYRVKKKEMAEGTNARLTSQRLARTNSNGNFRATFGEIKKW